MLFDDRAITHLCMKGYPFYDPEELNFLCCMYKLYERCGSYELYTDKEIAEDAIAKPMAAVLYYRRHVFFAEPISTFIAEKKYA